MFVGRSSRAGPVGKLFVAEGLRFIVNISKEVAKDFEEMLKFMPEDDVKFYKNLLKIY